MHFNKILKYTIAWKLVNTFFLFLINLLMVRLLGVTGSGIFFYDIAVLAFIQLALGWSLESGLTYYAAKDNSSIASLILFILPLLLFQGLLSWLILFYIHFSISFPLAIAFILSNLVLNYFSSFFNAKKWFVSLNIITCSINFITAIFLGYCWMLEPENIPGKNYYIVAYIINVSVQAFFLVMTILFSLKNSRATIGNATLFARRIFNYSSVALLSNIVFFLVTRIDYFFVQKYCSDTALGNYVQVSRLGQLIILVPSIIATVVFPYSISNHIDMQLSKVQQLCRSVSFIFIPFSIVIISGAYWVIPWIFGEGFNGMYLPLLLYLPGFFSLSIISILAANLAGKKLIKTNLVASVLALVVVVAGDVLLIPVEGINAAAFVSSVAYACCGGYLLWIYKTTYNCRVVEFFSPQKEEINIIYNQLKNILHYK